MPTRGLSVAQCIFARVSGLQSLPQDLSDVPPGSHIPLRLHPVCFLLASMEPEEEAFVRSETARPNWDLDAFSCLLFANPTVTSYSDLLI